MTEHPHAAPPVPGPLPHALRVLTDRYPGVPLLCLGQTVFWDEPVKAVVQRALETISPDTPFVVGVHDTDYFARPHATLSSTEPYLVLPHNDGPTRGLWCAAAEISSLLGAETVFTRQAIRAAGGRLQLAALAGSGTRGALLEQISEAWGWRGIAHTSGVETLAYEVPLAAVLPALLQFVEWGFQQSAETLCHCTGGWQAESLVQELRSRIQAFADANPRASLSDLYQELLPYFHALVRGESPGAMQVTHSLRESVFSRETASLPRFQLVEFFLAPGTREICRAAYDHAVAGSEIYPLEKFGDGAIPFDVVTPGLGRATLKVLEDTIQLEGRTTEQISTGTRVESVQQLAEVLETHFGGPVNLVGKAITWICLMAKDHLFVMHEGASGYTPRAHAMLDEMRAHGVPVALHPILRLQYNTFDALAAVPGGFCLPDHYAAAFGKREIGAREFAQRWRQVLSEQERLLHELGQLHRPIDLLLYLAENHEGAWVEELRRYREARTLLRTRNAPAPDYRRELDRIRLEHYRCGLQIDHLHKQRGGLRKQALAGTDVSAEREAIDSGIASLQAHRRSLVLERANLRQDMSSGRNDGAYLAARDTATAVEARAELKRLQLARAAYMVAHSLEHNQRRPTAWWFPLVAPDGSWFRALADSTTAYLEEL